MTTENSQNPPVSIASQLFSEVLGLSSLLEIQLPILKTLESFPKFTRVVYLTGSFIYQYPKTALFLASLVGSGYFAYTQPEKTYQFLQVDLPEACEKLQPYIQPVADFTKPILTWIGEQGSPYFEKGKDYCTPYFQPIQEQVGPYLYPISSFLGELSSPYWEKTSDWIAHLGIKLGL